MQDHQTRPPLACRRCARRHRFGPRRLRRRRPATSPAATGGDRRRDHADAGRLRGSRARLEQDHPGVRATPEGKGVAVTTSYGASGDQSRAVVDGKPADIVNFSVEPDVTRLVKADKVAKDWNADATKGIPFGSVVTLVVRKGNPKNIKDWDDLLQPGVEVVTPSPLSSGSAKWNLLAPYAAKSDGGKNPQAGLDFVNKLVTEHVKTRPGSGREATDVFLQGSGDVLISYENEAINTERQGKPVEHVTPPQTFKIENPVAVVTTSAHLDKADGAEELPVHRRRARSCGPRPASVRSTRRSPPSSPKDFPTPAEAVDHRRPRGMERRGSGVVRQGQRLDHEDLQAGHWMTAAVDPIRRRSGPSSAR